MSVETLDWVNKVVADGRYHVIAKLGEGGMGFVYRATDQKLGTDVVIKVPRRAMLDDPEFVKRFALEIRALVKLQHPHIVKVSDVGDHNDVPFAVMQFLAGGDLNQRRPKLPNGEIGPCSPSSIATWLPSVAQALDYIHSRGLIHRDVKPANILFDEFGHAYLSDFGVAKVVSETATSTEKITGTGMVLGTPEYMAPELIMGEACDGRVDQYALAVTVHELLCGRVPFIGATPAAILVMQSTQEACPLSDAFPSIPREVSNAVMAGIAKSPHHRYPDCVSFARAVVEAIQRTEFVVDAAPVEWAYTTDRPVSQAQVGTAGSAVPTMPSANPAVKAARWATIRRWLGSMVLTLFWGAVVLAVGLLIARSTLKATAFETLMREFSKPSAALGIMVVAGFFAGEVVKLGVGWARRSYTAQTAAWRRLMTISRRGSLTAIALGVYYLCGQYLWNTVAMPTQAAVPNSLSSAEVESLQVISGRHAAADYTNSLGVKMTCVLPGRFRRDDDKPGTISEPFWIAETEVTVAQYFEFLKVYQPFHQYVPDWVRNSNTSEAAVIRPMSMNGAPIMGLSRQAATAFCEWLSNRPGETLKYRLPTLDEWVCAYRGGTESDRFWAGDESGLAAHFMAQEPTLCGNYPKSPQYAHPWGIRDIAGNAWEMIGDEFHYQSRGGGWDVPDAKDVSVKSLGPASPARNVGFRLVAVQKEGGR